MRRIPIRARLTLAFAVVMAAVLTAIGTFVYVRVAGQLDRTVDEGLRSRADDVAALVSHAEPAAALAASRRRGRLTEAAESFVQILDDSGRVLGATPDVPDQALLTPQQLTAAQRKTVIVRRVFFPELTDDDLRLLATPARARAGRRVVVLVGTTLEGRDDALGSLLRQLLLAGPLALALSALGGYALAGGALRPVEAMRRRAAAISEAELSKRLPVPAARDELGRLGRTLNQMLDRLERAVERERTFVADASHELRTPLAILKTELELALKGVKSRAELEAALRSAGEEVDRLAQLAEDLLVIARADRGQLPVRPSKTAVPDVLTRVATRFERRATKLGRAISIDSPPNLTVVADGLRLEQALGNMVDNGLRHGEGAVELSALERNGWLELHVMDHGKGFPPAFIGRAFERFSRPDGARAGTGTGLGLAVVAAIALAHGGTARARNREDGGADVWISLPRDPREAGEGAAPAGGISSSSHSAAS